MAVRNIRGIGRTKPIPVLHFIPPRFNLIYKLELVSPTETIDITKLIVEGEFTDGVTSTIGSFNFKILDPSNTNSGKIDEFDTVNLYLDYGSTATTLRFSGKIERKANVEYAFLELSGRSVALNVTGINVTYDSSGSKARSVILKEIVDKYFSGVISTANIEDDLTEVEKNYSEMPFWDVVEDLCDDGGRDAYISPSLVMNYFLKGSRDSTTEAIVERVNLINPIEFAKDTEELVTKVRIYGQKKGGIPIIATSDSDTTITKGITKELKIDNANIATQDQAKAFADWKFERNKVLPTLGAVQSLMLPTIAHGERVRIFSPTNNIPPVFYEINSYTHSFSKSGAPKTIVNIKKPRLNIPEILKRNIQFQTETTEGDNPNEMEFSIIYDFTTETGGTKSNVQITDGVLKTTAGNSAGTWISPPITIPTRATAIESRMTGDSLASTQFFVDMTGSNVFTQIAGPNTTAKTIATGKKVQIKLALNSANTQIRSVGLLYKIT